MAAGEDPPGAAERINLLLRLNEPAQAADRWRELKQMIQRRGSHACELILADKSARIGARLSLAGGAFDHAIEQCESGLAGAERTGQVRKQVELLLLRSLAANGARNRPLALESIEAAISLAMNEGYIRVFVDEGEPLRALLTEFSDTHHEFANRPAAKVYLGQILRAMDPVGLRQVKTRDVQGLTRRERTILAKLQSSLSNREMADALFITEGTLKWHLKNIYNKLSVTNRMGALEAARRMRFPE